MILPCDGFTHSAGLLDAIPCAVKIFSPQSLPAEQLFLKLLFVGGRTI
jgi:hypothetical protein